MPTMSTPGRPSRINEVIGTRTVQHPDGTTTTEPVTVAERITEALRSGQYVETAAAMAGVHRDSVFSWLRIGANINGAVAAGTRTRRSLTAHEKRCAEFSDAVDEAQRMSEGIDVTRLAQLAAGGVPLTTVVTKYDAQGNVVERTERTEHTLPSAQVLTWRLERRFPHRWGRKTEVSGPEGGPIAVEVEQAGVEALLGLVERMEQTDDGGEGAPAPTKRTRKRRTPAAG